MIHLPLAEGATRDDVDDLAVALGLLLVNIVPKTDSYPAQVIYVTPDRAAAVHLVERGDGLSWVVRAAGPEAPGGEERPGDDAEGRWAAALRRGAP